MLMKSSQLLRKQNNTYLPKASKLQEVLKKKKWGYGLSSHWLFCSQSPSPFPICSVSHRLLSPANKNSQCIHFLLLDNKITTNLVA